MSAFRPSMTPDTPCLQDPRDTRSHRSQKTVPPSCDGANRDLMADGVRTLQTRHLVGRGTLGAMEKPQTADRLKASPPRLRAPAADCQAAGKAGYNKEQKDMLLKALFASHPSTWRWQPDDMAAIARELDALISEGMVLTYSDAAAKFEEQAKMWSETGDYKNTRLALRLRNRFGGRADDVNEDKAILIETIFQAADVYSGYDIVHALEQLIAEGMVLGYDDASTFAAGAASQSSSGHYESTRACLSLRDRCRRSVGNVNADKGYLLGAIFHGAGPWYVGEMEEMEKRVDALVSEGLTLNYEDVAARFMAQASKLSDAGKFDRAKKAIVLANKYTPACH